MMSIHGESGFRPWDGDIDPRKEAELNALIDQWICSSKVLRGDDATARVGNFVWDDKTGIKARGLKAILAGELSIDMSVVAKRIDELAAFDNDRSRRRIHEM